MSRCLARQESDQKVCHRCGLCWDMNDPDPPTCRIVEDHPDGSMTVIDVESRTIEEWPALTMRFDTPAERGVQHHRVRYLTARKLLDQAFAAGRNGVQSIDDIIEELQSACGQ